MHERRSFTCIPRLAFGLSALLIAVASLAGCDSSDADEEGDVITRIELRLQNTDTGEVIVASVGSEGSLTAGAVVQADSLHLLAGSVYDGRIDLFNDQGVNVTTQIRQQAEDYQLFYTLEGANGVVVEVTDVESDYGSNDFGDDLDVG